MNAVNLQARICSLMAAVILLAATAVVGAQSQPRTKGRKPPAKAQPSAQSNAAFDQAVKRGYDARQAGRLSEAFDQYAKALQMRPTWADGWWNIGAILYDGDR